MYTRPLPAVAAAAMPAVIVFHGADGVPAVPAASSPVLVDTNTPYATSTAHGFVLGSPCGSHWLASFASTATAASVATAPSTSRASAVPPSPGEASDAPSFTSETVASARSPASD